MANYIFEEMTDGDAEAFTSADTLRFSSASATPANVSFSNTGLDITFVTSGSKTLAFQGTDLAGAEILFTSSFIEGSDAGVALGGNGDDSVSLVGGVDDGSYAYGFAGDDEISGSSGADYIFGGAGGDTIGGGSGADHIYGFALTGSVSTDGDDVIDAGDGNDYIQGNAGADTLFGNDGNDRINGGGDDDSISGGNGNDTVNGNKGDDSISGGDGNDSLRGGANNDIIDGDSGNDVLLGDLGDDTIIGGDGVDLLTGGDGADLFVFGAGDVGLPESDDESDVFGLVDTITDFVGGEDTIDLPGVTVGMATVEIGQAEADVVKAAEGITLSTLTAATTYAQQLLDDNAGGTDVAVLEVGSDTYLFYNASGSTADIDSIIKLVGVDADDVTNVEFGGVVAP